MSRSETAVASGRRPEPIGLYLHVPFCLSKCPYCDFYSLTGWDDAVLDAYTDRMLLALDTAADTLGTVADTLYFGGGTPSLLGGRRLAALIARARERFGLHEAEITLEANPADNLYETFAAFAAAGGNRLSMGMQSADAGELHFLGRRHTNAALETTLADARRAGIANVSLDLMLALVGQTPVTVRHSAAACAAYGVQHVSAYLLKVEPNTPFAAQELSLPGEDAAADLYLAACAALEQGGFLQYEISNFARPGCESRHNLKYWTGAPYLGLGPAAHSFLGGKRTAFSRSLEAFLHGEPPVAENPTEPLLPEGSPEEFLMLRLRLTAGVTEAAFASRFGTALPTVWRERARALPPRLIDADAEGIRLTREGFLVSNAVIAALLGW